MLYPTHLIICIPLIALTDFNSLAIFIGCAIPDIIDKPLPKVGVVDTYHSVAHSLISVFITLVAGFFSVFMIAIAFGWIIHIVMDIIQMFINGKPSHWRFILWPVDFQDDPMRKPPVEFFRYYIGTYSFYAESIIWISAIILLPESNLIEEIPKLSYFGV
jgi:hypothetical protein